jgi:nicotinamidase-related amidase
MEKALPSIVSLAAHAPERTVFTRFIPPTTASDARGMWREYYKKWRNVTQERIKPELLDLVPDLQSFVPPANMMDRMVYSAFGGSRLLGFLTEREVNYSDRVGRRDRRLRPVDRAFRDRFWVPHHSRQRSTLQLLRRKP